MTRGESALFFHAGLQLTEEGPSPSGRTPRVTPMTSLNIHRIRKHFHGNTQNAVGPDVRASHSPVNLTH